MFLWTTETFEELEKFTDWLLHYELYPIEVYLNGITYKFLEEEDKLFFIVGMEAHCLAVEEIGRNGNMGI